MEQWHFLGTLTAPQSKFFWKTLDSDTLKIYIAPETEVILLNAKDALMVEFDPNQSTGEQLGNTGGFDGDEGGDPFFDN